MYSIIIYHFSPKMKIGEVEELPANLGDKEKCYAHKKLKQALKHELVLKKLNRVIKFNQEAWLKPNIDMNTELSNK